MNNVVTVFEELSNPFLDNSKELYALDTMVIMFDEVIEAVRTAEDQGKKQYEDFVQKRFTQGSVDFYDTISRSNLSLFKSNKRKPSTKSHTKIASLKVT